MTPTRSRMPCPLVKTLAAVVLVALMPLASSAAGVCSVEAGSTDNAIRLTFDGHGADPVIDVLRAPNWVRNVRIESGEEFVVRFDVAGGTGVGEKGTMVARITAGDESVVKRWPLRVVENAPPIQASYRITECCLAPQDVQVDGGGKPLRNQLVGGAPNPWRGVTRIRFGLAEGAAVTMRVFDITGRQVREIRTPELGAGFHQINWDGTEEGGRTVPPGMYVYEVTAGAWRAIGRSLLIR